MAFSSAFLNHLSDHLSIDHWLLGPSMSYSYWMVGLLTIFLLIFCLIYRYWMNPFHSVLCFYCNQPSTIRKYRPSVKTVPSRPSLAYMQPVGRPLTRSTPFIAHPPSPSRISHRQVVYSSSGKLIRWFCYKCSSINQYDQVILLLTQHSPLQSGDIDNVLPEMFQEDKKSVLYASSPPKSSLSQWKQSLWSTPPPFCDQCIQNQQKIQRLLADYLPEDHDPQYYTLAKSYRQKKLELESLYPPVCIKCSFRVGQELKRKNAMFVPDGYVSKCPEWHEIPLEDQEAWQNNLETLFQSPIGIGMAVGTLLLTVLGWSALITLGLVSLQRLSLSVNCSFAERRFFKSIFLWTDLFFDSFMDWNTCLLSQTVTLWKYPLSMIQCLVMVIALMISIQQAWIGLYSRTMEKRVLKNPSFKRGKSLFSLILVSVVGYLLSRDPSYWTNVLFLVYVSMIGRWSAARIRELMKWSYRLHKESQEEERRLANRKKAQQSTAFSVDQFCSDPNTPYAQLFKKTSHTPQLQKEHRSLPSLDALNLGNEPSPIAVSAEPSHLTRQVAPWWSKPKIGYFGQGYLQQQKKKGAVEHELDSLQSLLASHLDLSSNGMHHDSSNRSEGWKVYGSFIAGLSVAVLSYFLYHLIIN